jgi:gas vesicle protein
MGNRDEQPVVLVERGGGVGTFLVGAAVGALVALLLAPQSGAETRAQIGARVRRLREAAEDKLDDLQDAVETGYEKTKASIEAGLQRARRNIDERREDAKDIVGAGKSAVRTARDELERRLAEARAQRSQEADE